MRQRAFQDRAFEPVDLYKIGMRSEGNGQCDTNLRRRGPLAPVEIGPVRSGPSNEPSPSRSQDPDDGGRTSPSDGMDRGNIRTCGYRRLPRRPSWLRCWMATASWDDSGFLNDLIFRYRAARSNRRKTTGRHRPPASRLHGTDSIASAERQAASSHAASISSARSNRPVDPRCSRAPLRDFAQGVALRILARSYIAANVSRDNTI